MCSSTARTKLADSQISTEVIVVSHTHWDREWYRSFEGFRAHLVDVVDRVLELLDEDPGHRFLLDGQSIILDDYLELRPDSREALRAACRAGRVAVGPWYTQPDSFIPHGEAHVRNLLLGREVAERVAPRASRVAYLPDSYGHPGQFPQIMAGFGLDGFLYWRGDDDRTARFGKAWRWIGPEGSPLTCIRLTDGYCGGGNPTRDPAAAAERWARYLEKAPALGGRALLMNGGDHMPPDPVVGEAAERLAMLTGLPVRRGLLEDFVEGCAGIALPEYVGELRGAATANLLYGVHSTLVPIKLRNRRAEAALTGWLEPWTALGRVAGLADERPTLRLGWKGLLANQAHDSLVGASADSVTTAVPKRLDAVIDLALGATERVLARLAGTPVDRATPWSAAQTLAVFNPSPHPRRDLVRFPLDSFPFYGQHADGTDPHPLAIGGLRPLGFTVDGAPARLAEVHDPDRPRFVAGRPPCELEFVAEAPAFGWTAVRLEPSDAQPDEVDDGRVIEIDTGWTVVAEADGRLTVCNGGRTWTGLFGIEDRGDRGDDYDFEPVPHDPGATLVSVNVERRRHANGMQLLTVRFVFELPASLAPDRERRSGERVQMPVTVQARLTPGVHRVDFRFTLDNTARDHRLRIRLPLGNPGERAIAATTFDVIERSAERPDDLGWKQPAPDTFPAQGWASLGGLTVLAPGLPEWVVAPDGALLITVVRSTGWLSRADHRLRADDAGPNLPTPAAQCQGPLEAHLSLLPGTDPRGASDAEFGLRCVVAGETPRILPDTPQLTLHPRSLLLSALKPAQDGEGLIVRVLNATDTSETARLTFAREITSAKPVRLDETPADHPVVVEGQAVILSLPPHALRTVRVRLGNHE